MKRKVGLVIGYNGQGYHGLQWNRDTRTIESDIMGVLLKCDCVSALNSLDPSKIDMKSASRTDKGVHSSFNLLCLKICREPTPELESVLKAELSGIGIHLYKMMRLPKKFIGHKSARSRVYRYAVPTYFLQSADYTEEYQRLGRMDALARDSATASASTGGAPDDAAERAGTEEERRLQTSEDGDDSDSESMVDTGERPPAGGSSDSAGSAIQGARSRLRMREYKQEEIEPLHAYRADASSVKQFGEAMEKYVGTHDFSNFTIKNKQGAGKRFIRSVVVSEPLLRSGIEYLAVTVHGQSFLLHQIRKMIGFAVLNCRYSGAFLSDNFTKAFTGSLHIPKSPAAPLFLSEILFDDFNARSTDKIEVATAEKEQFEREVIEPAIYKPENILEWFKFLDAVRFHHENFEIFKRLSGS